MADEIQISGSLGLKSGYLDAKQSRGTFKITQSNVAAVAKTMVVTSTETALDIGEITTVGVSFMRNIAEDDDGAEWIQIGIKPAGSFIPFGKLYSADGLLARFATNSIYAKADTGQTPKLFYWLNDN